MNDAASFDAILQCNLLEVFCEALGAAIFVTDKLDEVSFASIRLLHLFPIRESAISPGGRARDLYGALYDAGCRFGGGERIQPPAKEDWIAERIACAWKERVDKIEQIAPDRWIRIVSRRFSSGLGFVVIQDVSEQKKKEELLRTEQERLRLTEDILDTLPVAVAVKDRNLDYVAVNQEFCRLLGTTREAILGHGSWEALAPELAGRVEQLDWQLLSSGDPGHTHLTHVLPGGRAIELERRARRLGKPGSHYIVVSLTEMSAEQTGDRPAEPMTHAAPSDIDAPIIDVMPTRNVIFLTETRRPSQALKLALRAHGIDLCYVSDVPELAALLPAIRAAGLIIDLMLIEYDFDPAAFNIAAASGVDFRMLPDGAEESLAMAEILAKLADTHHRPAAPMTGSDVEEEVTLGPTAPEIELSSALDVLAVEDNAVNRLVLEQMLGGLPYTFKIAGSASEALAECRTNAPRLVLSDMTLPDLDASDFVVGLRKLDPARPLIAVVQADTEDHRRMAEMAGFDESISKPLSAEILTETLRNLLAERPRKASTSNTVMN